jgi:hypothetical protein
MRPGKIIGLASRLPGDVVLPGGEVLPGKGVELSAGCNSV